MAKERINLLLERAAIERARRYTERHQTSISSLVSGFLSSLPGEDPVLDEELTATVRRLRGLATDGPTRQDYRDHLLKKHGR